MPMPVPGGPGRRPRGTGASGAPGGRWRAHVNNLWSVWYGVLATSLQTYLAVQAARRFLGFVSLPWPLTTTPPRSEVHAVGALTLAAFLVLPFFLASSLLRVGNLANDGVKLGRELAACSKEPVALLTCSPSPHPLRVLWLHGGPTAPFLHALTALLLLAPRLCIEARLIQAGWLPKESLFRPDLADWGLKPEGAALNALNATPRAPPRSATSRHAPHAPLYHLDKGLRSWSYTPSELQDAEAWAALSPELLNYGAALLVYAVRYPAVFWRTNKAFGSLFSALLVANGAQCLLAWVGASALYKVQVYGAKDALPAGLAVGLAAASGAGPGSASRIKEDADLLLLSPGVTLGLVGLSTLLVLASSLVLYLYGYGRLRAFLQTEAARRVVRARGRARSQGWSCFTHCAALCVLVGSVVVDAPLVHDWAVLYRGSLDPAVLLSLSASILRLLSWVALWLLLTVKHKWTFKLRVTVAQAKVASAPSVRLCAEVQLMSGSAGGSSSSGEANEPLLVVGQGQAHSVTDAEQRSAILGMVKQARRINSDQPALITLVPEGGGHVGTPQQQPSVYWPRTAAGAEQAAAWRTGAANNRKLSKNKVSFDEATTGRRPENNSDDGDYALLAQPDGSTTASTSAHSDVHGDSMGHPSPPPAARLLDDGDDDEDEDLPPPPPSVVNQGAVESSSSSWAHSMQAQAACTSPSASPSVNGAESNSGESSRTDYSNRLLLEQGSQGHPQIVQNGVLGGQQAARRAHSVADLYVEPGRVSAPQNKSYSLTRGMVPPQAAPPLSPPLVPPPVPCAVMAPKIIQSAQQHREQPVYSSIRKPSQGVALRPPQPAPDDEPERVRVNGPASRANTTLRPVRELAENGAGGAAAVNGTEAMSNGVPATLHLNGHDDTVVIRRHKPAHAQHAKEGDEEDKFGRATNMRMTSFTDQPDHGYGYAAATLPLPPPPPPPPPSQLHCATLPANSGSAHAASTASSGTGSTSHLQQHQLATSCGAGFLRQHSTIPTHHNGVLLYQSGAGSVAGPVSAPVPVPVSSLTRVCFQDHVMSPSLKYGLQQHLQQHLQPHMRAGVGAAGPLGSVAAGRDPSNRQCAH